jgi:hypothetical protein
LTQRRVSTLWLLDNEDLLAGRKTVRSTDSIDHIRLITIIIYKYIPNNLVIIFCLKQIVRYKILMNEQPMEEECSSLYSEAVC